MEEAQLKAIQEMEQAEAKMQLENKKIEIEKLDREKREKKPPTDQFTD